MTRRDAVSEGASPRWIRTRTQAGRWVALYPGVYRLAGAPDSWRQRLLAGVLVAGDGAVASHRAAARLAQIPGGIELVEVSVPALRRVRREGIIIHRAGSLPAVDLTVVDAIPVTTATRTLIDLAAIVPADVVEEALDEALRRGLTSIPRLRWRLAELGPRGRPGVGAIHAAIAARTGGDAIPKSVFETRLLRLLARSRLPIPTRQHRIRVRGRVIAVPDFAWPEFKLAIEADGYRSHGGRAKWAHDLARRNRMTALGWRVMHLTWSDLRDRPDRVVEMIAAALEAAKG